MKTLVTGLLGLLLVGCGSDPVAGTTTDDAGSGGVQLQGDAGPGGSGGAAADAIVGVDSVTTADLGSGGAGGAGAGGSQPGTGGAGSGGAPGTGGAQGSGGAVGSGGSQGGTGGAAGTPLCVDPNGWKITSPGACLKANPATDLKKDGHICKINCASVQPNGLPGNTIGPPFHVECITPPGSDFADVICVTRCSECQ